MLTARRLLLLRHVATLSALRYFDATHARTRRRDARQRERVMRRGALILRARRSVRV